LSWTIKASPVIPALEEAFSNYLSFNVGDTIAIGPYKWQDGDKVKSRGEGNWYASSSTYLCSDHETNFVVEEMNVYDNPFRVLLKYETGLEAIINMEGVKYEVKQ